MGWRSSVGTAAANHPCSQIFSTGQTPLSDSLKANASSAITPSGFVTVKPSFQVDAPGFERVFAVGDIADSGELRFVFAWNI